MTQKTKPEIWPTDRPFVVFMVPGDRLPEYAVIMNDLILAVMQDLRWTSDDIDLVGLVAENPQHGAEGIYFLEESGIDTRAVTLLLLWGNIIESVNMQDIVSEGCGIGSVILPSTGVMIPIMRMPSIDSDWWDDPLHQEYAISAVTSMVRDGRYEFDGTEPFVFMTVPATWN